MVRVTNAEILEAVKTYGQKYDEQLAGIKAELKELNGTVHQNSLSIAKLQQHNENERGQKAKNDSNPAIETLKVVLEKLVVPLLTLLGALIGVKLGGQ